MPTKCDHSHLEHFEQCPECAKPVSERRPVPASDKMKLINRTELLAMAHRRVESMLSSIQDAHGITTGDVAAQFFSGYTFDIPRDSAATIDTLEGMLADVMDAYQRFEKDYANAQS